MPSPKSFDPTRARPQPEASQVALWAKAEPGQPVGPVEAAGEVGPDSPPSPAQLAAQERETGEELLRWLSKKRFEASWQGDRNAMSKLDRLTRWVGQRVSELAEGVAHD